MDRVLLAYDLADSFRCQIRIKIMPKSLILSRPVSHASSKTLEARRLKFFSYTVAAPSHRSPFNSYVTWQFGLD